MMKQRDSNPLAGSMLLLCMGRSHYGFLNMRNDILYNLESTQSGQAALHDFRIQVKGARMLLGNLIRMRIAFPVIATNPAAAGLRPGAMRGHPANRGKNWRKQAPQITIITFQQVLPPSLMQEQHSVINIP